MHSNRVYGLDILRAIAVMAVVYGHGYYTVSSHVSEKTYSIFALDGVTLFFVLSGFLIGGILLKIIENNSEFTFPTLFNFWIRRWFRTLPNYFFILIILLAIFYFKNHCLPNDVAYYFFFSQNINSPHPTFYSEAWSLSVEEWFYLTIPLSFYLLLKPGYFSKKNVILFTILAVLVMVTVFRCIKANYYGYDNTDAWDLNIRKCVITRMDSIMLGVLCSFLYFYKRQVWFRYKNSLFVIGLLIILYIKIQVYFQPNSFFRNYIYLSLMSIGTACLIPKLSSVKTGKGFIFKAMTFVSLVSYSAYLINLSLLQKNVIPVINNIFPVLNDKNAFMVSFNYIFYWLLTFGLAYFTYRFVEQPAMKLRDKFGEK